MEKYIRLLTDASDQPGSNLVKPKTVEFNLYNAYPDLLKYLPLFHKNLAVFYGNLAEKNSFLKNFFTECNKNSSSIEVFYYAINENEEEKEMIKSFITEPVVSFRDYRWGVEQLVEDWMEVRAEVKKNREEAGLYEAFNRRLNFVVFDIPRTTPKVYEKLYSLVKDSRRERIFIILLTSNANNIPRVFHKVFDLEVFLGRDNQTICDYVHPQLSYGLYDIQQKHIGTAFVRGLQFLLPLHPIEYKASQYGKEERRKLDQEYDNYLRFLESL